MPRGDIERSNSFSLLVPRYMRVTLQPCQQRLGALRSAAMGCWITVDRRIPYPGGSEVTDPKSLQPPFATKSARSGLVHGPARHYKQSYKREPRHE